MYTIWIGDNNGKTKLYVKGITLLVKARVFLATQALSDPHDDWMRYRISLVLDGKGRELDSGDGVKALERHGHLLTAHQKTVALAARSARREKEEREQELNEWTAKYLFPESFDRYMAKNAK